MRIGVDARSAVEVPAGQGRVVRELLRALAARDDDHRYLCYARRRWEEPLDERFEWRLIERRDPLWHLLAARSASSECDVFLASNSFLTVLFLGIPAVAIVYDLVTFDRSLHPNRRALLTERATLGAAVRRAAAIVAISHSTAGELVARFPRAAGKVTVAHLGVSPALEPDATLTEPPGFVLAVGTLEPRKNLPRLVEAYAMLPDAVQAAHRLVVAGKLGWGAQSTMAALRSLGERAHLLGYVSDAQLAELYRRCAVFCYPSLGEGFGLPVLEAMAAGAAVLTASNTSLPEVGGEAVEYAEATDTAAIAAALARLLADPQRRAQLGSLARERAASFSWAAFAAATLETLERAAREGR